MYSRRRLALVIVLIAVPVAAALIFFRPALPAALEQSFDGRSSAFTFDYPAGWDYTIPIPGVLVVAPEATLYQNAPGPTFTVQRANPLSVYDGSLDAALSQYLSRGPLSAERQWQVTDEARAITFLGRDARRVELYGRENDASPLSRARIVTTAAANTFVYYLVITAPDDQWADLAPTLEAVLNSVEILE